MGVPGPHLLINADGMSASELRWSVAGGGRRRPGRRGRRSDADAGELSHHGVTGRGRAREGGGGARAREAGGGAQNCEHHATVTRRGVGAALAMRRSAEPPNSRGRGSSQRHRDVGYPARAARRGAHAADATHAIAPRHAFDFSARRCSLIRCSAASGVSDCGEFCHERREGPRSAQDELPAKSGGARAAAVHRRADRHADEPAVLREWNSQRFNRRPATPAAVFAENAGDARVAGRLKKRDKKQKRRTRRDARTWMLRILRPILIFLCLPAL